MPLNCALKNGENCKFGATSILPPLKKKVLGCLGGSVGRPTLGSRRDLMGCGIKSHSRLHDQRGVCFSPSPSAPPLSLTNNKKEGRERGRKRGRGGRKKDRQEGGKVLAIVLSSLSYLESFS